MDTSAQIILFYDNVFCSSARKPRVRSGRRGNEDNAPCLRLVWLVIETSVTGNLYIFRSIHDVNARPILRLIVIGGVIIRNLDGGSVDVGAGRVIAFYSASPAPNAN